MKGQGGLGVFKLALEAVGDGASSVFNAGRGGSHRFFGGPLHHGLQGDGWIAAAEAHQHVLGHRLGQSAAFLFDAAADSILQMGYLCRDRIKEGDRDAIFGGRAAGPDRAEAEGGWDGIRLAQEALDTLCITSTTAWRSSSPFWATASSCICHSLAASLASWSVRPASRALASSSRAKI
jgi:hypothetical protein